MELLELIQTLNAAHGPSGDEGGIREKLAELARPLADEISTDAMGNLIVRKLGSGPRVMLCAHMDSIGFIVTHVEENGFLRVGRSAVVNMKYIRQISSYMVTLRNGVKLGVSRNGYAEIRSTYLEWKGQFGDD